MTPKRVFDAIELDSTSIKDESGSMSPPTTPKRAAKKAKAAPSPTKSTSSSSTEGKSPKAKLGAMIIEAGIKALSKAEVYEATGITPAQQKDMLRKDKGSLRNALMGAVSGL